MSSKAGKLVPDAAEPMRYVYFERPQCPLCASVKLKTERTEESGEDSTTRRTRCVECGHAFFVVLEIGPQNLEAVIGRAGILQNMLDDTHQRQLLSVGGLANLLQVSPADIKRAAVTAGIAVTLLIDGRPYFSDADVVRFRDVLNSPEPRT